MNRPPMNIEDWRLSNPPDSAILPCICGGQAAEHDLDEEGNVACSCTSCSRRLPGMYCAEYREAEPCDCGAMPWQRCGCDDAYDRQQDGE